MPDKIRPEALGVDVPEPLRSVCCAVFGVHPEEVTYKANLYDDFGMESIDTLDIVFRLERTYGIPIHRFELFPDDIFEDPDYVEQRNGVTVLTLAGRHALRVRFPYANLEPFLARGDIHQFNSLVMNVEHIARFLRYREVFDQQ